MADDQNRRTGARGSAIAGAMALAAFGACGLIPGGAFAQSPNATQTQTNPDLYPEAQGGGVVAASLVAAEPASAADPQPPTTRAPNPYRQLFFENDFIYLDEPDAQPVDWCDRWKRMTVFPNCLLDVGGEFRLRSHHEDNLRLDGRRNDFLLQRTRLYAHARYARQLALYGEVVDATSSFERLPPRATEENRLDFNNLFAEALIATDQYGQTSLRLGRQEMIYGSHRLISNRPWRNSPLTFDGGRAIWQFDPWEVNAFLVRPVDAQQHPGNDHNFDHPDHSQHFAGLFAIAKPAAGQEVNGYFLRLVETDPTVTSASGVRGGFDANLFGARWKGQPGASNWRWDLEGGYQFGGFATDRLSAGFFVAGGGYEFRGAPWSPSLWAYYDWASGDSDPTDSRRGTFNHYFPRGAYLGRASITGRQNIEDLNFRLIAKPTDRLRVLLWHHIFWLEEPRDALYSGAGRVRRSDPTGAAGDDVGSELDLIVTWDANRHTVFVLGYNHFFAGPYMRATGNGDDADFVYVQVSVRL